MAAVRVDVKGFRREFWEELNSVIICLDDINDQTIWKLRNSSDLGRESNPVREVCDQPRYKLWTPSYNRWYTEAGLWCVCVCVCVHLKETV